MERGRSTVHAMAAGGIATLPRWPFLDRVADRWWYGQFEPVTNTLGRAVPDGGLPISPTNRQQIEFKGGACAVIPLSCDSRDILECLRYSTIKLSMLEPFRSSHTGGLCG